MSIPGGGGGAQLLGGQGKGVCHGGIDPDGICAPVVVAAPGGGGWLLVLIQDIICGGLEAPGGGGGGIIPGGPGCHAMACAVGHGGGIPFIPVGMAGIIGPAAIGGGIKGRGASCGSNILGMFLRDTAVAVIGPFLVNSGGGPSPNSAISDMYSSSILALSPAAAGPPCPGRFCRQSLAICPAAPQLEHTILFVTFGLSGH